MPIEICPLQPRAFPVNVRKRLGTGGCRSGPSNPTPAIKGFVGRNSGAGARTCRRDGRGCRRYGLRVRIWRGLSLQRTGLGTSSSQRLVIGDGRSLNRRRPTSKPSINLSLMTTVWHLLSPGATSSSPSWTHPLSCPDEFGLGLETAGQAMTLQRSNVPALLAVVFNSRELRVTTHPQPPSAAPDSPGGIASSFRSVHLTAMKRLEHRAPPSGTHRTQRESRTQPPCTSRSSDCGDCAPTRSGVERMGAPLLGPSLACQRGRSGRI